MEQQFPVTVSTEEQLYHFSIVDYAHREGDRCKFEVFQNGTLVASFEPDYREYLRICKNPGGLDRKVLYMVADQIEAYHL